MAPLHLDENPALYQIRSYQPGSIQINERTITTSVIVTPTQLIENWPPQTVSDLTTESFATMHELKPDVLLIGTGATHVFLALDIYGDLINKGIGVEVMSTSAACRTYNALSAEGRHVVAALLID